MQDRPGLCNNAGPSLFPTALDETRTSLVSLLEITHAPRRPLRRGANQTRTSRASPR
jgi:hypothetical protein